MVDEGEYASYQTEAFHLDELKHDLETDIQLLSELQVTLEPFYQDIQDDYSMDDKAEQLRGLLGSLRIGSHDILQRGDRAKKLIVFTQFTDTVKYLQEAFEQFQARGLLSDDIRFASATSDTSNVEDIIQRFAPEANDGRDKIDPSSEIDVLFATDVAGEGINLQDANLVINYDLHWNPLRLIQRISRVDRLGSWPVDLQAALDRAGIEYVSVHEQRLLAIYRTGIFNVVIESGSVSSARAVEVACWEGPLPSHTAGTSPQELLDDFTSVFEHGSTQ